MRSVNVGLAEGYDAVRDSTDFTGDLRQEFYSVLNGQVDWYQAYVKVNPYNDGELSNYYIRGHLTGTVVHRVRHRRRQPARQGGWRPQAAGADVANEDVQQPGQVRARRLSVPKAATRAARNSDELRLFNIWANQMGTDVAGTLDWTSNLVPATIHATKPDLTYYDGGDWSTLPAIPPTTMLQSFVQYQPTHRMAPFARQLLSDLSSPSPIPGTITSYKTGADAFPLSFVTKGTGAMYGRSDWTSTANWVSLAVGPVFETGHEHYDRAHITFQRGKDYLIMNAGGYGITNTLPWHNTLGFDDKGAGDKIVYPPGQGLWADPSKTVPPKYQDHDGFLYGQEDFGAAYVDTDGTTNSVTRAVRTMVFVRPDVVFIHDQAQVANAAVEEVLQRELQHREHRAQRRHLVGRDRVEPGLHAHAGAVESDPDDPAAGNDGQRLVRLGASAARVELSGDDHRADCRLVPAPVPAHRLGDGDDGRVDVHQDRRRARPGRRGHHGLAEVDRHVLGVGPVADRRDAQLHGPERLPVHARHR